MKAVLMIMGVIVGAILLALMGLVLTGLSCVLIEYCPRDTLALSRFVGVFAICGGISGAIYAKYSVEERARWFVFIEEGISTRKGRLMIVSMAVALFITVLLAAINDAPALLLIPIIAPIAYWGLLLLYRKTKQWIDRGT